MVYGGPAPDRPQYNVPQQQQMGQGGPAVPLVYNHGGSVPVRPQHNIPQQEKMGPNPGASPPSENLPSGWEKKYGMVVWI